MNNLHYLCLLNMIYQQLHQHLKYIIGFLVIHQLNKVKQIINFNFQILFLMEKLMKL